MHLQKNYLGGYIGVEFFFIVSGYYIGEKAKFQIQVIDYLKTRLRKLYPHYSLSLVVAVFMRGASGLDDFLEKLRDLFWSLLMLQNMGLNVTLYNGYLWYVTYLIYGGTLIYLILIKFNAEKVNRILAFYVVLFYFIYIYFFHTIDNQDFNIIVPLSFYRALAAIVLGVLINKMVTYNYRFARKYILFKKIVMVFISLLGILLSFWKPHTPFDLITILCFAICIGLSNMLQADGKHTYLRKILTYIGGKTYLLYCYQIIAFFIIGKMSYAKNYFSIVFVCVFVSVFFDVMYKFVKHTRRILL